MFCSSELPMWFQLAVTFCGALIVIGCGIWGSIAMWRWALDEDGLFGKALVSSFGIIAGTALGAVACFALGGFAMCIMFVLTMALC